MIFERNPGEVFSLQIGKSLDAIQVVGCLGFGPLPGDIFNNVCLGFHMSITTFSKFNGLD